MSKQCQKPSERLLEGPEVRTEARCTSISIRKHRRESVRYLVVVDLSLGVLELLEVPGAVDPPVVDEAAVLHADESSGGLGGGLGGSAGILAEGGLALEGAALLEGAEALLGLGLSDGVHADGADGAGGGGRAAQGVGGRAGEGNLLHGEGSHFDISKGGKDNLLLHECDESAMINSCIAISLNMLPIPSSPSPRRQMCTSRHVSRKDYSSVSNSTRGLIQSETRIFVNLFLKIQSNHISSGCFDIL